MIQKNNSVMPLVEIGEVISNREISECNFELIVKAPNIAKSSLAGQFVHIRIGDRFQPFLRRPLSIGSCKDDKITLIFVIRGEGTRILSTKKCGDTIDMIGPLGNPFSMPRPDETAILIAGGIGIAPLLLLNQQIPPSINKHLLLGVRSKETLTVPTEYIERYNIRISSDDGSIGFHGNVVEYFQDILHSDDSIKEKYRLRVYSCGPQMMLYALKNLCTDHNIQGEVSLEVPMGCGLGACQACVVPNARGDGYRLVCKDGPVFDMKEVDLKPSVIL